MDIYFNSNGSISGAKTNFMKELVPMLTQDKDEVTVLKIGKKSTVLVCYDVEGHMCDICLEFKNKFVEIKSPVIFGCKICKDCLKTMNE